MLDYMPGGIHTYIFLLAFAATLALGFIIIPILKRRNIGQYIREDGPASHLGKSGTPTMGGIIFIIPAVGILAVMATRDYRILPQLLVTTGFGIVGLVDDLLKVSRKNNKGLSPIQKTVGIIICAALFSCYAAFSASIGTTIAIPLTGWSGGIDIPYWIYIPFTILVMYGASNAVNFTDGVDGLATSVTMLVMISFTLAAAISVRNDGAAALTAAFAGGCLGFLFFNAHPARVMMGECGSLALGGAVSAAAVVMRIHWILLFFGAIYVAEGLSVVIQVSYFKRTHRRVFKMAPIHHHFELSGWSESRIVLVFCCVTFIFCGAGLWLLFGRLP